MGSGGFKDLTGQAFGRWTVVGLDSRAVMPNGREIIMWKTICTCTTEGSVCTSNLTKGKSTSCGCLRVEQSIERSTTHGKSRHPLQSIFQGMKARCYKSYAINYDRYGGRGITICQEWLDNAGAFIEWGIANNWNSGLQVDRIDNDGPYAPWNCRLVTPKVNNRNRRTTIYVTMFSEKLAALDALDKYGTGRVEYKTFVARLKLGWDVYDALYTPKLGHQGELLIHGTY